FFFFFFVLGGAPPPPPAGGTLGVFGGRQWAAPTLTIAKIGTICPSEQHHSLFRWHFMMDE
ncbi:MAG: hypothetical protein LUC48_06095, partial [Clostridiales bacterium]|nr:hypothetical protein [Clostridiales bacterium]